MKFLSVSVEKKFFSNELYLKKIKKRQSHNLLIPLISNRL